MSVRWLRCDVDRGMFTDERAVTYRRSSQSSREYSFFVPASAVEANGGAGGRVRVEVLDRPGGRFAVFPDAERSIVDIDDGDLEQG